MLERKCEKKIERKKIKNKFKLINHFYMCL